jgi:hypothetical protein
MTITELYQQLADKDFQDPLTGNLFFPAYMYVYDEEKEYETEQEILNIKERLYRPNSYLNVLIIDIFQEFQEFLKQESFGSQKKFGFYLEQEEASYDKVQKALQQDAHSDRFFIWFDQRIRNHFNESGAYEVGYVFVKGFGAAYPYLRASKFMSKFEKYITGYKMILFYPGTVKENYNLFGLLNDENLYRAIKLINQ